MNSGAQSAHKPPISERSRRLFEVACLGCRVEKKKVRKRCGNPSRRRPPYIIFLFTSWDVGKSPPCKVLRNLR